ncbi:MAG: L-aspartate oxidase [Chloroflexaceae bacterium]|nr:L-aspartate oxidase [Chloroflexaceae bacterium]
MLPWSGYAYATCPAQLDVLIVGAGAAGLYAALCLPETWHIGLITKEHLQAGASDWAQGGIAAALAPADSPELHLEDTLRAGAGLCDRAAVEYLVTQAPQAIQSLLAMGVAFDRKGDKLALTLEAAHSQARVLHAADTTGRAIVSTLAEQVLSRSHIQVFSEALALQLWLRDGCAQGVWLLHQGQVRLIQARAVILATGGGGQVFARTTNPTVSTGDGVAIAWRAGAVLRDLEFIQFHPTALTQIGAPPFLISEAVRGEGAHLIDRQGNRFLFAYHAAGELAPRDVVSRAIFDHLQKHSANPEQDCVYLDLSPISPAQIRQRFPNIMQVCAHHGIDLFREPIPVAPAAHYWMGGIATDLQSATSIPGLYAIGEAASTGVHGANRLASNSLLECLVYAQHLSKLELQPVKTAIPENLRWETADWNQETRQLQLIRQDLPRLMWRHAGIVRSHSGLATALKQVEAWRQLVGSFSVSRYVLANQPGEVVKFAAATAEPALRLANETLNLLDIAYLTLKSAIFRAESRGGHYRSDYPHPAPQWQAHTFVQGDRCWLSLPP